MSSPAPPRTVVALASIVIVALGLRLAGAVILPVLTAVVIAIVSIPVLRGLERAGVPRILATILTLLLDVGVVAGFVALALSSLSDLNASMPRYSAGLEVLHRDVVSGLTRAGFSAGSLGLERIDSADLSGVLRAVFSQVTEIASNVLLVVLLVAFLLFELPGFERKLSILLGSSERVERVAAAAARVQRYLVVKTGISILVASLVWITLAALGVDFPLFWALATFLLNYLPSIGPALATAPSVLVALLTLGPAEALAALVLQLSIHLVVGSMIEPRVMGEALGISTFVVLGSMLFWGWLWGPVGALFAVPLTSLLVSLLELAPETRWLGLLLSSTAVAETKGRAWGWSIRAQPPTEAASLSSKAE